MKTRNWIIAFLLLFVFTVQIAAQDAISLVGATIERSASDVASWPITTTITSLTLGGADCNVEFDAKNTWPDVPIPGWSGGSIAYTLWMVRIVNGAVYTGGGIEFWRGRVGGCGPAADYVKNWYYNDSWGPLNTAGELSPGERVGWFVTAGDARAKDVRMLTARSAVVATPWPGGAGGSFTFSAPAPPPPPVVIVPVPAPPPPPPVVLPPVPLPSVPWPQSVDNCRADIAILTAIVEAGRQENRSFFAAVGSEWKKIMVVAAPIIGALVAGLKLAPKS